jgi:hypothetical protein
MTVTSMQGVAGNFIKYIVLVIFIWPLWGDIHTTKKGKSIFILKLPINKINKITEYVLSACGE